MPSTGEAGFRRIGERERLGFGFFRVVTGTFVDPEGYSFEREIVRHPGAVCVVAVMADGHHVAAVKQYRAAVDASLLELPAGKRDLPDEPPVICAARELVEEVGYEAAEWTELGRFFNSPGFSDEETIVFLARDLVAVERDAHGTEEAHMTVEEIDLDDLDQLVATRALVDAKSIIACQMAKSSLKDLHGVSQPASSNSDQRALEIPADSQQSAPRVVTE